MINRQRSKYDMFLLLKAFLLSISPAIFLAMPNLAGWFDEFVAALTELTGYFNNQERIRLGYATYKRNMRKILEDAIADIAATLMLFATATAKPVLLQMANYKDGVLQRLSDADLIFVANLMKEQAQLYVAELVPYDITVVTIALFGDKIDTFVDAKSQPRDEIYDKKESTAAIKATILVIDELFVKMDRAVLHARRTQRLFNIQYFDRRKIVEAPRRMLAARGKVTDQDGNPIPKVDVTCDELGLKRKTTAKGGFLIKVAPPGEYQITFSRPGYQSITLSIIIADGIRTQINVAMLPHAALIPA